MERCVVNRRRVFLFFFLWNHKTAMGGGDCRVETEADMFPWCTCRLAAGLYKYATSSRLQAPRQTMRQILISVRNAISECFRGGHSKGTRQKTAVVGAKKKQTSFAVAMPATTLDAFSSLSIQQTRGLGSLGKIHVGPSGFPVNAYTSSAF